MGSEMCIRDRYYKLSFDILQLLLEHYCRNGNMAPSEDLFTELNKFKKDCLIDFLINKKVPINVVVSNSVRKLVECNENSESTDKTCILVDPTSKVSLDEVRILKLESELQLSKTELEYSKKLMVEYERSINNQQLVIDSFRSIANQASCDVAIAPYSSQKPKKNKTNKENKV